jgi:pimeloyl-ACP methyl ester carboxylesterase
MNKWYLLPGMGANSSMYDSLRRELEFEINFINWPKYGGEKTFSEAAERVIKENGIEDGDIVGGSSLGGMVALEIARLRKLKAIVLIGSAISPAEVNGILSLLAPLCDITPISFIQRLAGKHEHIITRMFAEADSEFIKEMCQYLPKWSGANKSPAPLFRVHGQKDHVIPCPKVGSEIIANAGHLLALTHPKECGEYLNKINRQLTPAPVDRT